MKLYWTLKSIPELADLPAAERRRVWRATYRRSFQHWQTWLSLVGIGLFVAAGQYVALLIGPGTVGLLVGVAIGGGVGGFIHGQVVVAYARPYLGNRNGA